MMSDVAIDLERSKEAQSELQQRLSRWLEKITRHEGFTEWKNKDIKQTLLAGLIPDADLEPLDDFQFPKELEQEHTIVSGYYLLLGSLVSVRECEFYFRRFPFSGLSISRESHLKTCCELFFSRVYQFKARWLRHLKQLNRRTKLKDIPIGFLEKEFQRRFDSILSARNKIHHEEDYSDVQLKAIGLGDLLSTGDKQLEWLRMSQASYRRITKDWVARVQRSAEQLDLFVGVTAVFMLNRCHFLREATLATKGKSRPRRPH